MIENFIYSRNMESFSPDKTDLQLLDLLQHDAGQSNQQLAAQVNVSPRPACGASSACMTRV